jgi:hypothetical protein
MKAYAFGFTGQNEGKIFAYPTVRDAVNAGNGYVVANSPDDLVKANVTMGQMVGLYNQLSGSSITKFSDRPTGAKRLLALAEAKALKVEVKRKEEQMVEAAVKEKATDSAGKKGRSSAFEGRTLKAKTHDNPRREGTHGHKSMAIIIAAGDKGISYEDFIAAGGRRVDLAWDFARQAVEIH